jgi:hypothetical protein
VTEKKDGRNRNPEVKGFDTFFSYSSHSLSDMASMAGVHWHLNITAVCNYPQAILPRSQNHKSRQVQQMAAPLADKHGINYASGVDRDDAQETRPLELLWV